MINDPIHTRGNIYLSGSMEFAPDGQFGKLWREECAARLKEMKYLPLDITALDEAYAQEHGYLLRDVTTTEPLQRKMNIRRHFIDTDLNVIQYATDALIVLLDDGVRKGAGTISECQFAYNHNIPIFVVNSLPPTEKVSGWFFGLSTKMFDNFDQLYEYLDALPYGIIKKDAYENRRAGNHYLCSLCGTVEEKHKTHFVSKVSPLYCKSCVGLVKETYETHYSRYQFFIEHLNEQSSNQA